MTAIDEKGLIQSLGREIAKQRKEHGLTQKQLAEKLGISQQYLQAIEAGRRKASIPLLVNFTKMFSVTTDELLNLNKPTKKYSAQEKKENKLLIQLRKLPKPKQQFISEVLEALTQQQKAP